jgi:hypothetical protein
MIARLAVDAASDQGINFERGNSAHAHDAGRRVRPSPW